MKLKQYPKYKESGVQWIGKVPEGWEVKKLKHVTDIWISNVDKKSDENEPEVLLCNYIDVYKNEFITSDIQFMKATASYEQIRKLSIKKNDVIITKDSEEPTDIAVPALVNENLHGVVCGYHLALIRPNPQSLHGAYLLRSFQSKKINDQFVVEANGVTRFGISTYPILNSYVLIPPITEQSQIATFLDAKTSEIVLLIEKDQKLIELLKEKRIALINHAVTKGLDPNAKLKDSGIEWVGKVPEGWTIKKIKYVSEIVLGKMLSNDDSGGDKQKPYLRAQNILWEKVDVSDIKEMWFSSGEIKTFRLKKNDLLVSEGGEAGRTALWSNELEECYIQNSVHKITIDDKNHPNYILYQFESLGKKGYFESIVSRVSIAHLTREKLKEVYCIIPSKPEQLQIAAFLDAQTSKIDQTVEKIQLKIELLSEYKKSLIHHVVTGKVDVRDCA